MLSFGLALFGAAAALVACQGGGANLPVLNTGTPTFPPVPPFSQTTTQPLPQPVNGISVVQLPSVDGFGGSIALPIPSVPVGTTVTTTYASIPPSGIPPLAQSRRVQDLPPHTNVLYACVTLSISATTSSPPTFIFTAPAQYLSAAVKWFLAQLIGNVWNGAYAGPSIANAGGVTFVGTVPLNFTANQPLCFGVIVEVPTEANPSPPASASPSPTATPVGATPTPTPTAAPTSTPTATPTAAPTPTPVPGALVVNPSTTNVTQLGSSGAQTVNVSESGYNGTFTMNDQGSGTAGPSCGTGGSAIATVTPSSASGPSATFTITGVNPGQCRVNFTDTHGQTSSTYVYVTTNGFIINGGRW